MPVVHGDAQVHPLDTASCDVAISRFGAMFFGSPVAAFANIRRALRPGGRLAMLSWWPFASNEWLRVILGALTSGHDIPTPPNGAPGPFGLADAGDVTRILVAAEFVDVEVAAVDEPMWFGADTDDAFDFVRNFGIVDGVLGDADAAARGAALDRLRDALDVHATGDGVLMGSAAWLTTARRPG